MSDFDKLCFRDLVFFDHLVNLGSLTAAAREMRTSKPTASRWLASIEARAGASLIIRNSHNL